jgi:hypothetical protein
MRRAAALDQCDASPVTLQGRDLAARQAAKEAMSENAELVRQKTEAAATARRRTNGRPATAASAIQRTSEVSLTRLARVHSAPCCLTSGHGHVLTSDRHPPCGADAVS